MRLGEDEHSFWTQSLRRFTPNHHDRNQAAAWIDRWEGNLAVIITDRCPVAGKEHQARSLILLAFWHGILRKPHPYWVTSGHCLTGRSLSGHLIRRFYCGAGINAKFPLADETGVAFMARGIAEWLRSVPLLADVMP